MNARSVDLVSKKTPARQELKFIEQPLVAKQVRLHGRTVLKPELDIRNYRCRAVIDWIDLVFRTDRATQWIWLQREIEKAINQTCDVRGRRAEDQAEYRLFRVRFQEPEYDKLLSATRAVDNRWGLQAHVTIENLEISVDFQPKQPSDEALGLMFGLLVRTHLPSRDVISDRSDRPRFAWGEGSKNTRHILPLSPNKPERSDELLVAIERDQAATLDSTYYAGAKGSRSAWRIMTKLMDKQNKRAGSRVSLPEKERRVRAEVTLNSEELEAIKLRTLNELQSFRFQTLQGRYFQFWLPTFAALSQPVDGPLSAIRNDLEERRRTKFMNAGVLGLKTMDQAQAKIADSRRPDIKKSLGRPLQSKQRRGTGVSMTLVAFNELSRPVKYALRHLGQRVRSSP
ncbi:MAG: hypothetical protein E5X65_20710 [Mesorhizobium sp.]|nr:MAG: hypothetical protein E5X65_20710 [Mesorhizobium sp.]